MAESSGDWSQTLESVQRQLRELQAETSAQMQRMADQMRWYSADAARAARSGVREWPATSVLGAFALGLVVGALVGAQSRHNPSRRAAAATRDDPFGGAEA